MTDTRDNSLYVLVKTDRLSIRTFSFCRRNGFKAVGELANYFKSKGTFVNLKGWSEIVEKEINELIGNKTSTPVAIVKINFPLYNELTNFQKSKLKNHIDYLLSTLSVRAYNCLQKLGHSSIEELIDNVIATNVDFRNIRNAGEKTVEQLDLFRTSVRNFIATVHQSVDQDINGYHDLENIKVVRSYHNLTPVKKSTLNHHIAQLLSTISVRAANCLSQQFGTSLAKALVETAIAKTFNFRDIPNAGEKTVQELKDFTDKVKTFITILDQLPNDELSKEYTRLILKTTFPQLSTKFDQDIHIIFDEAGRIKLFTLIDKLIFEGVIFNSNERQIFNCIYSKSDDNSETLDKIGVRIDLTKERVRQIKKNLEEDLESRFTFILNLNATDIRNYEISHLNNVIIIDEEKAKSINMAEGVQYTKVFYSIILGILLKNTHEVFGVENVIQGKTKRGRQLRNCYLIEKKLFHSFNFEKFLDEVYLKLNDKIDESYSIYLEGYVLDFFSAEKQGEVSKAAAVCEQMLFHEFDLVVDSNGFLQFERTTRKRTYEYALEILQERNNFMTVTEISKAIKNKYPELKVGDESLRASIQRERGLFIFIGRSSTYGLKKWEQEAPNIKGGTIRDIVEEYLEMENEPKHIGEIVTYVLKYRNTNEKNVLSNLKLVDNDRFLFYHGGFIGIKSKAYDPSALNFKKAMGTKFTKVFMSKFNNWDLGDVIAFYVTNYGYTPSQIKHLLANKCRAHEIQIVNDKIVIP